MCSREGFVSLAARNRESLSGSMKSWADFARRNILDCDDEMMMFEGGDRLEKNEGMELTWCEEYDIMLEYVH